ncbi:hypothetical protein BGZ60DRAFT_423935 [Tricladium varicosporioides]|nr:hypothetical protein BGZ60DRAFT_423935 [Hymenoscyphus varicosporioides]
MPFPFPFRGSCPNLNPAICNFTRYTNAFDLSSREKLTPNDEITGQKILIVFLSVTSFTIFLCAILAFDNIKYKHLQTKLHKLHHQNHHRPQLSNNIRTLKHFQAKVIIAITKLLHKYSEMMFLACFALMIVVRKQGCRISVYHYNLVCVMLLMGIISQVNILINVPDYFLEKGRGKGKKVFKKLAIPRFILIFIQIIFSLLFISARDSNLPYTIDSLAILPAACFDSSTLATTDITQLSNLTSTNLVIRNIVPSMTSSASVHVSTSTTHSSTSSSTHSSTTSSTRSSSASNTLSSAAVGTLSSTTPSNSSPTTSATLSNATAIASNGTSTTLLTTSQTASAPSKVSTLRWDTWCLLVYFILGVVALIYEIHEVYSSSGKHRHLIATIIFGILSSATSAIILILAFTKYNSLRNTMERPEWYRTDNKDPWTFSLFLFIGGILGWLFTAAEAIGESFIGKKGRRWAAHAQRDAKKLAKMHNEYEKAMADGDGES